MAFRLVDVVRDERLQGGVPGELELTLDQVRAAAATGGLSVTRTLSGGIRVSFVVVRACSRGGAAGLSAGVIGDGRAAVAADVRGACALLWRST